MFKIIGFLSLLFITNVFANNLSILDEVVHARESIHKQKNNIFQQSHHLVFFFASSCPHCHNFAPILKKWSDANYFMVESFSFDGKTLPNFPNVLTPNSQLLQAAFQNESIRYPALFVVNTETANLYPVSIGELNDQELEERMQTLIPKIIAFERGVS